jgi:hypothetical protein
VKYLAELEEGSDKSDSEEDMELIDMELKDNYGLRKISFVDKKLKDVQANRLKIINEYESSLRKRIEDKILKRQSISARQHLQAFQTSWMLLISQFSRIKIMTGIVEFERAERRRWMTASRDKKSVRVIELWWPLANIYNKLYRKHPRVRFTLATLFMNRWRKLRISERYRAQALIKKFISDVTGLGETMRKVYLFRVKVIRTQRWVKSYFKLYFARIQVLWKMLQREEAKLMHVVRAGMRIKSFRAKRSLSTIRGFGEKAKLIDQVSTNISSLLKYQEGLQHQRKLQRDIENRKSKEYRKSAGAVSDLNSWRAEIIATEDGVEKLSFLTRLLMQLRFANIVKNDAMKHRTVGKGPRADFNDAKLFLVRESNSMPKLADTLKSMEDPSVKVSIAPFYMLTGNGGGLDVVKEWIGVFMRRKYKEEFELVQQEALFA